MPQEFKLDRNAFAPLSIEEADNQMNNYKSFTPNERLLIAAYLNSVAFNYDINNPSKMDKTIFEARTIRN